MTGTTGFVGQGVVSKLVANDCQIKALVRKSSLFPAKLEQVVMDLGEIAGNGVKKDTFCGVDVVVHIAARVHMMQDQSANPLAEFRKLNRDATLALASSAADAGVKRFVFLSSIKVNGEETFPIGKDRSPCIFKPDDAFVPTDPYGLSKYEAERGLQALAKETGMEVVIIRPPLVYGAGVKGNFVSMIRWVNIGMPLPLGAIHNSRTMINLDNLVDLIITCFHHPSAANQIFLVGDGEDISTTELLKKVGRAIGKPARLIPVPTILLKKGASLLGKSDIAQRLCGNLQVDISKARDLLDWHPPFTVDEGIKKAVDGFLMQ